MTPESLVPLLIGAGGLISGAVLLYRARADKTAVVSGTHNDLMEAAVATAKGLAEASAMVVEPLRGELVSARERLAVVEKHAQNCEEKLDLLRVEFADLRAKVIDGTGALAEAREAQAEARTEVAAQATERERVQERDRKIDEGHVG